MTYLLIKATSTPAPKGSKIDGITKATENYSFSVFSSVWLEGITMSKGSNG